jgi:hypothetical protein
VADSDRIKSAGEKRDPLHKINLRIKDG